MARRIQGTRTSSGRQFELNWAQAVRTRVHTAHTLSIYFILELQKECHGFTRHCRCYLFYIVAVKCLRYKEKKNCESIFG